MMKKVLCIGDSTALPGHENRYEDTWIYLLKKAFRDTDFVCFFQRAMTTDILTTCGGGNDGIDNKPRGADVLEFYEPEIVVIQLGVVDCAPRLIDRNAFFYKVLIRTPASLSNPVWKLIKRIKKRNSTTVDVPLSKFTYNLENYISRAIKINVRRIILIKICTPDERIIQKSPEFNVNVKLYNAEIDRLEQKYKDLIISIDPLNEEARIKNGKIYHDGYHPNALGHSLVYQSVYDALILNL